MPRIDDGKLSSWTQRLSHKLKVSKSDIDIDVSAGVVGSFNIYSMLSHFEIYDPTYISSTTILMGIVLIQ